MRPRQAVSSRRPAWTASIELGSRQSRGDFGRTTTPMLWGIHPIAARKAASVRRVEPEPCRRNSEGLTPGPRRAHCGGAAIKEIPQPGKPPAPKKNGSRSSNLPMLGKMAELFFALHVSPSFREFMGRGRRTRAGKSSRREKIGSIAGQRNWLSDWRSAFTEKFLSPRIGTSGFASSFAPWAALA